MDHCTIDIESRSYSDLLKTGAYTYWENETTSVICICWGINSNPIQTWWPGKYKNDDMPYDLHRHIVNGGLIEAHNLAFERSAWVNCMSVKYGWPVPADDQWRDTMAVACYYALPAKLDKLANVLGFEGKDPEGGRLITKYSKLYLKTAKTEIPHEDFDKFVRYCVKDVQIEQSVSDFLGDLPDREMPIFLLDQEINMRGLYLDLEGIEAATRIVEQRAAELGSKFEAIAGFKVSNIKKLLPWFQAQGLQIENCQAETLQDLLDDEENPLPSGLARTAIELRLQSNKASVSKLARMARARGKDGRSRWQVRYHGAATGRQTASGWQVYNLVRGFDPEQLKDGTQWPTPEGLVRDIMYGSPQWLDLIYGDAIEAVSKASRHWIMAEPGNRIIAGDYVSIEAVVLACLAGEQWKIDAFRNRVKIYEHTADKIYKLPPGTVTKKTHPMERQDGKTCELALGFGGGLNAWLKFDSSGRHSDERINEIKDAWRAEHPATVALWHGLEAAAIEAVRYPGRVTGYRDAGFEVVDEWLSMIGLDGKRIWYWKPQLRAAMPPWHTPNQPLNKDGEPNECYHGTCGCKPRPQVTYMAQKNGQWRRISTYSGKLAENFTQFMARQVLKPAMLRLKKYKYNLILDIYDEIVSENKIGFGSAEEYAAIMEESPGQWADTWPINVDVWIGPRYKK